MKKTTPKHYLTLILVMSLVCIMLIACGGSRSDHDTYDSQNDTFVETEFADLTPVPGYDYLYYSITTHHVFYLFKDDAGYKTATGFMSPYLINGHTCQYVGGEIIEIIEE